MHSIDNPTDVPVDVGQRGDVLFLLVDNDKYKALTPAKRRDFRAYLRTLVITVEIGGGKVQVSRLEEP